MTRRKWFALLGSIIAGWTAGKVFPKKAALVPRSFETTRGHGIDGNGKSFGKWPEPHGGLHIRWIREYDWKSDRNVTRIVVNGVERV